MKCRAEGSGMHVMKHGMVRLSSFLSRLPPPSPPPLQLALVQWRQHLFTPLQPPITSAILCMVAQPYIRSSVFAIPEMIEYLGIIGYKVCLDDLIVPYTQGQ
jgi:hypothetical protein